MSNLYNISQMFINNIIFFLMREVQISLYQYSEHKVVSRTSIVFTLAIFLFQFQN